MEINKILGDLPWNVVQDLYYAMEKILGPWQRIDSPTQAYGRKNCGGLVVAQIVKTDTGEWHSYPPRAASKKFLTRKEAKNHCDRLLKLMGYTYHASLEELSKDNTPEVRYGEAGSVAEITSRNAYFQLVKLDDGQVAFGIGKARFVVSVGEDLMVKVYPVLTEEQTDEQVDSDEPEEVTFEEPEGGLPENIIRPEDVMDDEDLEPQDVRE